MQGGQVREMQFDQRRSQKTCVRNGKQSGFTGGGERLKRQLENNRCLGHLGGGGGGGSGVLVLEAEG